MVALPQVARGLNTNVATITWVVTGPLLAFAVVAPLAGKAGDLWGHKRLFLTGIALEAVVALVSATAPSAGVLIAARTIGGLVGASVGAGSMALVLSAFDASERVKALGFWSLVGAGGPVLGVAIGGPVIEAFGWRAMFALQAPLLLLAAALAMAVLPDRAAPSHRVAGEPLELDWTGALSIASCVGAFLFALNRGPGWGWSSPGVLCAFGASAAAGMVFFYAERRAREPIFPLRYLRRRNFIFPVAAQGFSNFAYLGGFFMAPLLLEEAFGYAHRQGIVGFLVMPRPLVFSTIAPIAGYFAVRTGERTASVVGTAAVVASMAVFTLVERSTGLALVEVGLVLSGAGLGISAPSLSASVANEFEARDLGAAERVDATGEPGGDRRGDPGHADGPGRDAGLVTQWRAGPPRFFPCRIRRWRCGSDPRCRGCRDVAVDQPGDRWSAGCVGGSARSSRRHREGTRAGRARPC